MRILATLLFALALAGCAVVDRPIRSVDSAAAKISTLAVNDLAAAEESAKRHDDRFAAECWSELRIYVERLREQGVTDVVGVATTFQKARNIRRGVAGGLPEIVHVRCAHMLDDARSTILGIARVVL